MAGGSSSGLKHSDLSLSHIGRDESDVTSVAGKETPDLKKVDLVSLSTGARASSKIGSDLSKVNKVGDITLSNFNFKGKELSQTRQNTYQDSS